MILTFVQKPPTSVLWDDDMSHPSTNPHGARFYRCHPPTQRACRPGCQADWEWPFGLGGDNDMIHMILI